MTQTYFRAGRGFARFDPIVGCSLFLWFGESEGNLSGPWPPIGGRALWDGSVSFWRRQIKQVMAANIDALYVHCIDNFHRYRSNFFEAYSQLRSEGCDPPKIAPFLDPFGIWGADPIDVATSGGQREFARPIATFFEHYFEKNSDPFAPEFLLHIDGKPVIATWWVVHICRNLDRFQRAHLVGELARLADRLPSLGRGVHAITTAMIEPDLAFSDEKMVMFSGYAYAIHCVSNDVDCWHVQPGYWDQNIRNPGYCLPREGGVNYRRAWDAVNSNLESVKRVYIESWNEYDEGSGIYAADPKEPYIIGENPSRDSFSSTDDPYEYIRTTAKGASIFNRGPALASHFLGHAEGAESVVVRVRNTGNRAWEDVALRVVAAERCLDIPIDADDPDLPGFKGVCRGGVAEVEVLSRLLTPRAELQLVHAGAPFGEVYAPSP